MRLGKPPRRPQPSQAQKDAAWAELQAAQEELKDLRAFLAEVLDVCASARIVHCPACQGTGLIHGSYQDVAGVRYRYDVCGVCENGQVIA